MKVIYDHDGSSDDVIALIYLLSQPKVKLLGITVAGTGEAHGIHGAHNTADLCYLLGHPHIPIAYGSEHSCDSSGKPFPGSLRQAIDHLFVGKDVPKHASPTITDSAVDLLKRLIEESEESITLLATGPVTNIAHFIQQHPHLTHKIERIVIMGGAVFVDGNIPDLDASSENTVAEWNIYADPKAADIVFSSGIPVTLVSLDATNQVPMTEAFYQQLSLETQPQLKLFYELLNVIVGQLGMEKFFKEFYLWDPLAAMICVNPAMAVTKQVPIIMDVATAHTKPVDKTTTGAAMIDVAVEIPNAHLVLQRLVDEIKANYLRQKMKVSQSGMFQPVPDRGKADEQKVHHI